MKQAIKYSNDYIGIVDKPMLKAITLFANKNWQKAYDLFHTDNENSEANLLASFGKLYCAAQLENNNAENDAHIVLNQTNFEFWAYLKEHNFPRYARRFAYQFLAYIEKEKSNFEDAINYINEALYINSPIDDLDNIPLLELKAEIYLEMKNEISAFFTIQKILNLDAKNETFIEIINTNTYKKYLEMSNIEQLKKGTENETAIQALKRFEKFLAIFFEDDQGEIETFEPDFYENISEKNIVEIETKLDFKFPPSYRNFILKFGLFSIGEEFRLLQPNEVNTLDYELNNQWSEGYKNTTEEILRGAKDIITFSYGDESLQNVWYYCFDKRSLNKETGEMAVYKFSQDNWNFEALEKCDATTFSKFTNRYEQNNYSFDKHISNLIDEQIEYILDEY